MQTHVQKWGNSLALRIPKSFAAEIGLTDHTLVEVSLSDGGLIVTPVMAAVFTLDQLLAGITQENIHSEIETGAALGNETW
jgi:antitoxin MazE